MTPQTQSPVQKCPWRVTRRFLGEKDSEALLLALIQAHRKQPAGRP